jgi:NADH:ubiquinone reductase (non-electrogenic)
LVYSTSQFKKGGGPTGIEIAAELHDFLKEDLKHWYLSSFNPVRYPEIAEKVKITCVEATDHVLPMFSRTLIDYTEKVFAENNLVIKNNTQVTLVEQKQVTVRTGDQVEIIPFGLIVWATVCNYQLDF